MRTADLYAAWVDPAELVGRTHYADEPWCRTCGYRADRSPLAGGCDCPDDRGATGTSEDPR